MSLSGVPGRHPLLCLVAHWQQHLPFPELEQQFPDKRHVVVPPPLVLGAPGSADLGGFDREF
jgi:hypothetical protein